MFRSYSEPRNTDVPGRVFGRIKSRNLHCFGDGFYGRFSASHSTVVESPGKEERDRMRVAVLWTTLSGYLNACMKELASREGVELFVSHQSPSQQAPFDDSQFAWIHNRLVLQSTDEFDPLARLRSLTPRYIFLRMARAGISEGGEELAKRCWRVLAMDNHGRQR